MPKKQITLAAKLCKIMKAVERVAKRGENELDDYVYATEGDVKEAFRLEMARRNVFLAPQVLETRRFPITLSLRGGAVDTFVTEQRIKWTFHDGDTGECIECIVEGAGEDSKDKGVYKAMTGSLKSLLLTSFLLRSGDDPDQATQTGAIGKEVRQRKVDAAQDVAREKLGIEPGRIGVFYNQPEDANGHFIQVFRPEGPDATPINECLAYHGKFITKTGTYKIPVEKFEDLRWTLSTNYKCDLKELKPSADT